MANMKLVDELLKKLDWEKVVIKRHHKFIKCYLETGSLKEMSKKIDYPIDHLDEIFNRIQKQLENYNNYGIKGEYNKNEINNLFVEEKEREKRKTKSFSKVYEILKMVEEMKDWDQYVTEAQKELIQKIMNLDDKFEITSYAELERKINVKRNRARPFLVGDKYSIYYRLKKAYDEKVKKTT